MLRDKNNVILKSKTLYESLLLNSNSDTGQIIETLHLNLLLLVYNSLHTYL